jgi:hypothetical protein
MTYLVKLLCSFRTLTALLCLGPAMDALGASLIVDTSGFESFSLATISGQQGWVETPGVGGSAVVQSAIVHTGSNALQVSRAANADKRWTDEVTGFPTTRFVLIDWDMRVNHAGGANGALGPFFGVEAYDSTPVIGLIGSLGVDATTGEVLYQQQDSGALAASGGIVAFDSWHHYRLLLDYNLKKYSAYLDGVKLVTEGFVDQNNVLGGLADFTDADISALAALGDAASLALTGTAYFDNFRVWDGIPGDFNSDGAIDAADLSTWQAAFGSTHVGDADGDLDSDGADFLVWQREMGFELPASVSGGAAVPEPAGTALWLVVMVGFSTLRPPDSLGRRRVIVNQTPA